ncbi:hypothetical protein J3459_017104 [Metarhizium acridum]|nr:hypothetical protein J3459_017104 [Metarhizium acridum]
MLQTFSKGPENFPLFCRLLILHLLRPILGHLCPPDSVHTQVFIQNHKQAVQPSLTETLGVSFDKCSSSGVLCAEMLPRMFILWYAWHNSTTYVVGISLYFFWINGVRRLLDAVGLAVGCRLFCRISVARVFGIFILRFTFTIRYRIGSTSETIYAGVRFEGPECDDSCFSVRYSSSMTNTLLRILSN